ncbi:MAG: DNA repair protein RecO [Verrucomicrobiales bacterium]
MINTSAILLRRLRLTETSLIVSLCSPDQGLIKTVAKGALRPKSPFAGRLDLFLTADIAYAESRRSDLHILREITVTSHRFGLRNSWSRVLAASYFVHLLEQVAERATPLPDHFALLTRALDYLESHDPSLRAILHYERELARLLGIQSARGDNALQALRDLFHVNPSHREKLLQSL